MDPGEQRVPDDVAVQPGVERGQRAMAAAGLRARRPRDLRAERALLRPEPAPPGRVPAGADQLRRRAVPPAPGPTAPPWRTPGWLSPAWPASRAPRALPARPAAGLPNQLHAAQLRHPHGGRPAHQAAL